jgi:hypothetical protein
MNITYIFTTYNKATCTFCKNSFVCAYTHSEHSRHVVSLFYNCFKNEIETSNAASIFYKFEEAPHTHTHTHTIYIYIIVTEVNKGKGKFVPVAYDGGSIAPRILDLDTMR